MQEGKTTSSDTEIQTQQIACRVEDNENSNKINLDKLMSKQTQFALLLLFVFALMVTVIPELMVNSTMSFYNDTTLANTHVTTSTNLIIAFVTVLYVWLTRNLVTTSKESIELSKESIIQNKKSIELSKEAIKQSRKEQYIRDIENRLKKFYIPADEIINHPVRKKSHIDTVHGCQPGIKDSGYVIGLKDLRKYSYLADKTTYNVYEKYILRICENRKSITCRDYYRDFNDYNCTHKVDNCVERNWGNCKYNFERCEHFDKCPTKDQNNIIINNTECEYYKVLKNAITQDIKKYKQRLSELKEQ